MTLGSMYRVERDSWTLGFAYAPCNTPAQRTLYLGGLFPIGQSARLRGVLGPQRILQGLPLETSAEGALAVIRTLSPGSRNVT